MVKRTGGLAAGGAPLGRLIEQLGPLNNRWRAGDPPAKVLTLWDMGELLLRAVPDPSDTVLWSIQEKSYITRMILRYALIVRRGWPDRSHLEGLVRGLRNYTVFREALPFLKGDREGIDAETYGTVVTLLDSTDPTAAIRSLKQLKASRIGRRHRKGASVTAVRDHAGKFAGALAELESKAASGTAVAGSVPIPSLVAVSRLALAVATGESITEAPAEVLQARAHLPDLVDALLGAVGGGRASQSAFRKVLGVERLMAAADLLHALGQEATLLDWRRRRGQSVTVGRVQNRPEGSGHGKESAR